MKKKGQLSKKMDNLKGLSKLILKLLKENPTTKYIIQKTGKSKTSVGKCLGKLVKLGYIERISLGIYRVIHLRKSDWVIDQVIQNQSEALKRETENLPKRDYLRLHNLDIQLQIPYAIHKQIFNLIFNRKMFKNIRSSGTNKGYYFDVDYSVITFMITRNNLFAKFPESWEIIGEDVTELISKVYDEIKREVNILETRYHIPCFKDGRINFNIRNMHIALVNNGIVKEAYERKINNLVIYDEVDGKPRFMMDFSKLRFELEAPHPKHAFDDIDEAKYFMENLKDGNIRSMIDNNNEVDLQELTKIIHTLLNQVSQMAQMQTNTQIQLETFIRSMSVLLGMNKLDPRINPIDPDDRSKDKPDYVG